MMDLADDLVRGETVAESDAQELPADGLELVAALPIGNGDAGRADERPRPLLGLEDVLDLELLVGLVDRVEVDLELDGEAADGRELIADLEMARGDPVTDLVDDLAVERHAAFRV